MAAPGFESGGPFRQVPLRYFGYANERKELKGSEAQARLKTKKPLLLLLHPSSAFHLILLPWRCSQKMRMIVLLILPVVALRE